MKIKTLLASTFLLLAVAACGGTGGGAISPPAATGLASPTGSAVPSIPVAGSAVHVLDFRLDPKAVTIKGAVSLAVTNDGPTVHNVSIRDASGTLVGATKDLEPGQSETLTVNIPAGSYVLFCSLPGHESLGIKGTLTVTK